MTPQPDSPQLHDVESMLHALLVKSLSGDDLAYSRFLQKLAEHLRKFLRKRLYRLQDDIEDLVQEILIAIHAKRSTYRPTDPLTPWIHAIARHKLIDHLRASSRGGALHEPLDAHEPLSCIPDAEHADARRDVETMLRRLPHKQRLLIVCIKLRGLSVMEAAQITGWSESAIKTAVHRGMKSLCTRMQTSHDAEPRHASFAL
ncbi:MAG TPA: sigma-70 family RNA polymerase sigma factor [Paraburkholderia sp.]|jgi:RNA polymerase sigma-70 factor (ECF subfamily)|nr:sigma-70 family RNA polymerase sigma factor [Paraburkholderia sp.]